MSDIRLQRWNERDPEFIANQRAGYDRLREVQPLAEGPWGVTVLRYADLIEVARDPKSFSNEKAWQAIHHYQPKDELSIPLASDPPEHRQYRALLRDIFTPSRVGGHEPAARALAAAHIGAMVQAGTADVVPNFSDPYPLKSLCTYIGWEANEWAHIKRSVLGFASLRVRGNLEAAVPVMKAWRTYIRRIVEQRRAQPREDVASWLVAIGEGGRVLNEEQIVSILDLLLIAGHGTTTTALSCMIEYLALNPDQQDRLRQDRALLPAAIEEMFRYESPQLSMPRRTTCPVSIAGIQIPADTQVWLNFLAANRDPRAFDDAHTCQFDRKPNRHIAFGSGIHTCIGAPFARMEIRVALEELLDQTSRFTLAQDGPAPRLGFPHNHPTYLNVRFEA